MPDVLMLSMNDWANVGYRWCEALRACGVDAEIYKVNKHPFGYSKEAPLISSLPREQLQQKGRECRVLAFPSGYFIDVGCDVSDKPLVVHHVGSEYRQNPDAFNAFWNSRVKATVLVTPDLCGLGAFNEHYVAQPIDVSQITPKFERARPDKLVIGHFPSSLANKGTAQIVSVIDRLMRNGPFADRCEYVGIRPETHKTLPWPEHLERVAGCDIIIETLCPMQGTKKLGEWGCTALEGAAMGKIVVTNCLGQELYEREYGDIGLAIANTEDELVLALYILSSTPDDALATQRRAARKWVEDKHSYKATGQRLLDCVYGNLL